MFGIEHIYNASVSFYQIISYTDISATTQGFCCKRVTENCRFIWLESIFCTTHLLGPRNSLSVSSQNQKLLVQSYAILCDGKMKFCDLSTCSPTIGI
jgi:hypothetical protein